MPVRVGHAVLDRIPACTWDVEGVLYWLLVCPCDMHPASFKDASGFDHGEDSKQASLAYISYIHV